MQPFRGVHSTIPRSRGFFRRDYLELLIWVPAAHWQYTTETGCAKSSLVAEPPGGGLRIPRLERGPRLHTDRFPGRRIFEAPSSEMIANMPATLRRARVNRPTFQCFRSFQYRHAAELLLDHALASIEHLSEVGSLSVGPKIFWWLHRQRFAVEKRWKPVEINSRRGPGHCRTEKP